MRRARVLAPLPRFYGVARVCDVSGACCVQMRGAGGEEGGEKKEGEDTQEAEFTEKKTDDEKKDK